MKKLALFGGAAGAACALLFSFSQAADHLDSPSAAAAPMADIGDVYAWMTSDAAKVNLALTVSPGDNGTRTFGPSVVYAFHVNSRAGFGMTPSETKIVCKFASDTDGACWVIDPNGTTIDYLKGDFSATAGVTSASGKVKVFAGRRSDPFFFNLGGTKTAIGAAETLCGTLSGSSAPGPCPPTGPGSAAANAGGCLRINSTQAAQLRGAIGTKPSGAVAGTPCGSANIDCFIGFNVMAIVVQIDKTEVNQGSNALVSVWASTHTGS